MILTDGSKFCSYFCEEKKTGESKDHQHKPPAKVVANKKPQIKPVPEMKMTVEPQKKVYPISYDPSTVKAGLIEFGKHKSAAPPSFHERIQEILNTDFED